MTSKHCELKVCQSTFDLVVGSLKLKFDFQVEVWLCSSKLRFGLKVWSQKSKFQVWSFEYSLKFELQFWSLTFEVKIWGWSLEFYVDFWRWFWMWGYKLWSLGSVSCSVSAVLYSGNWIILEGRFPRLKYEIKKGLIGLLLMN